jgi:hypothetical protein
VNSIDYVQNRVRKSSKVLVLVLSVDTCRVYRERERERERERGFYFEEMCFEKRSVGRLLVGVGLE